MAKEYRSFSERQGLVARPDVQLDKMDYRLINSIWNFSWQNFFQGVGTTVHEMEFPYLYSENLDSVKNFYRTWQDFFFADISAFSNGVQSGSLRQKYSALEWYRKYDFLEWTIKFLSTKGEQSYLLRRANREVLELNHSGYRFIKGFLVPISSEVEIKNLSKSANSGLDDDHIAKALTELNKRKNRDTMHIAVESMNAVESALKTYLLTKMPDAKGVNNSTTGKLLQKLEESHLLTTHSAYMTSMSKLYGYLSQVGRHGQASDNDSKTKMSLAEATYILEVCSAFVNYLKADMQDS